jgi:hypothetical protein
VPRKRFKASESVDTSNRCVCTHRSARYGAECHFAVGWLQLTKCFAQWALHWQRLLSPHRARRLRQPDQGRLVDRPLHWLSRPRFASPPRTTLQGAVFRPGGHHPKFAFLARHLGQTRCVVQCMQCARESLLLFL